MKVNLLENVTNSYKIHARVRSISRANFAPKEGAIISSQCVCIFSRMSNDGRSFFTPFSTPTRAPPPPCFTYSSRPRIVSYILPRPEWNKFTVGNSIWTRSGKLVGKKKKKKLPEERSFATRRVVEL